MPPQTRKFKNGTYRLKASVKTKLAAKSKAGKLRKQGWLIGIVKYKTKKTGTKFLLYGKKK